MSLSTQSLAVLATHSDRIIRSEAQKRLIQPLAQHIARTRRGTDVTIKGDVVAYYVAADACGYVIDLNEILAEMN
jgi:hypothetical protein